VDLLSMNILDFSLNSNGNIIQSFSFDKYPLASPSLKPQLVKVYEEALARRVELIDTLSGTSETLLNQLIDVEEDYSQIYPLDIQTALRPATLSGQVVPVLGGASFRNMGVQPLMDAIVDYLPSPKERPQLIVSGDKELNLSVDHQAFSALAFKVTHDHQKGPLVFVRVYSGTFCILNGLIS
jgi:elongation factor G